MNDAQLIQIVDAAMAEAVRKSGSWLACRIGCTACCIGPFPITPLDAQRLRAGFAELAAHDPERTARVRARARVYVDKLKRQYPGDTLTRVLAEEDAAEQEPCPALDPQSGACDLYAARPITCRTFGPAVRFGGVAVAVCELCYQGATDSEIASCQVEVDPENLEEALIAQAPGGESIVGWVLAER
jgi:Fe-S-cluster containining protein